jgi:cellulose synthase/poly-beta-1,6-N-acetylglucosamine synthase-like glycosyltransferase
MAQAFGQYGKNRLWEIVPGAISWTVILGTFLLAFLAPEAAIVFIILFDLYWMLRVFYFVIHVIAAYRAYRQTIAVDWWERVQNMQGYDDIYHVVMLPFVKEDLSILEDAVRALLSSKYRADRMVVVLGGEGRMEEHANACAQVLASKYAAQFAGFFHTIHPPDLPGEIVGKGSNLRFMAGELKRWIDAKCISCDKIIVSAFDVDTLAHPQYFAKLTELFLTVPEPTRTSFQPVTVFSNNIWTATAPVRIAAFGTTFWLLGELVRPERMWTFSSHSMPWRMLVDVGFWEPDLVSEDSRIFMQAFLRYDGKYRVTPVFLPAGMDTVVGDRYLESLWALYKQQRRWAWGVEHVPYMVEQFKRHPNIPFLTKCKYLFNHIEGMVTWSTAPIIIFALGYLPFATLDGHAQSALVANSPFTLEFMMRGATIGAFITGGLSFMFLPPRPAHIRKTQWLMMLLQWLLLPVTFMLFGAFPAIDAQTRLMFGKYLGFNVTRKASRSK